MPAAMAVIHLRDPDDPKSWELVGAADKVEHLFTPSLQTFLHKILAPSLPRPYVRNLAAVFREAQQTPRSVYLQVQDKETAAPPQFFRAKLFGLGEDCAGLLFEERDSANLSAEATPEQRPELARVIVWRADPRTLQFTYVSEEAERLLGYWPERWLNEVGFLGKHLHPEDRDRVIELCREVGQLDEPRECECRMVAADGAVRWFYLTMRLYPAGQPGYPKRVDLGGVMTDITQVREIEAINRELSRRLIHLRDQEQRRISRELHDGLGQLLIAIRMNLDTVAQAAEKLGAAQEKALRECVDLTEEAIRELRSMSYLLHPPALEEMGLPGALRAYVDGYTERSGVAVRLKLSPERFRLPEALETTLFRIVQECLTNIHRHAQSASAEVAVSCNEESVDLLVQDHGQGIPRDVLSALRHGRTGVGIAAMRERMGELGGEFEISSTEHGTVVQVRVPRTAEVKKSAPAGNGESRPAKAGT
jgi:signal transduction histidine kinase